MALTSLYMFLHYLYHGTLIPFSKRIGRKSFLEFESNSFSKSINREREREREEREREREERERERERFLM